MPGITNAQIAELITETVGLTFQKAYAQSKLLPALFGFAAASNELGPNLNPIATGENPSAGTFIPGAGYTAPGATTFVYPKTDVWGAFNATISFTDLQRRQMDFSERNGRARAVNYLGGQLMLNVESLFGKLHTGMISGTGANSQVLGLTGWLAAANTIFGVNRAVDTNFGVYVDTTGGAISASLVENVIAQWRATVNPNEGNYVALCDYKQERRLKAALGGAHVASPVQQDSAILRLGYAGVSIDGGRIPVIAVPGYTGGRLDVINRDAYRIEVLGNPSAPFELDEGSERAQGSDTHLKVLVGYVQSAMQNPRLNAVSWTGLTDS